MKYVFISFFIIGAFSGYAQKPLIDRSGEVSFFSEAPLENIEATNNQALGALDPSKGTIAVSMLMKGFHFEKSLMEEHFNENYVESDTYPKSTFQGKLKDFSSLDFDKPGTFEATSEGEITVHGVTQPLTAPVTFEVTDSSIKATTTFNLKVADFDIKIPGAVVQNIAEEVEVKGEFNFTK